MINKDHYYDFNHFKLLLLQRTRDLKDLQKGFWLLRHHLTNKIYLLFSPPQSVFRLKARLAVALGTIKFAFRTVISLMQIPSIISFPLSAFRMFIQFLSYFVELVIQLQLDLVSFLVLLFTFLQLLFGFRFPLQSF